jgi:hypothetical protein
MPYNAQVFRVMIASPSDVTTERNLIRSILADWNVIYSLSRSLVLLPVGWESHSAPDLSGRPQEIINKKVLKDCDLLVGVFWTRIGTSTGGYASGTVEEIEEHIAAGKPVMLYFSGKPVDPESVEADQYKQLKEFKAVCYKRGLVESFLDETEFKDKFTRQLQIRLNEDAFFTSKSAPSPADLISVPIPSTPVPHLTEEARQLLVEAAKSGDGTIMFMRFLGGVRLNANGKEFITDRNPKTRAIWEGALEELLREGLIVDRGHKREMFAVTREGYELAELFSLKAS